MKKSFLAITTALGLALTLQPANAFFRAGGFHGGWGGGFAHGTVAGPRGVAHVSDAGGFWHGTAVGRGGAWHGGAYGGAWHDGVWHGGAYYHSPVVVHSYGGCVGCWGAGAVAAGAIAGAAVATAAAASAWPVGGTYGYLPTGCVYDYVGGMAYYHCPLGWLRPAYGANGVYYRVVATP
ncbi:hypothetical protein K9U39_05180 [Rhodoblastus acidophilus]|uniref:Uncharacterized protein n=1 Tax=Candidatus Rhodoblastus alkanivorans TaxID=2954117 RepID=A0ABS9Z5V1_9HYPH|nr:hypothetical protein [Candidatus Rhodoblastus alkanivorans]MCI4678625.1 hypothetical protein [Candidatus Rhodoblastus alkanivorans]MCI4683035.1 hypothetical protein [Candidatus Rhodoblastus alkanivorans]MDI4640345.1 hypothetical protein [Rhodoblastus acidophilus]